MIARSLHFQQWHAIIKYPNTLVSFCVQFYEKRSLPAQIFASFMMPPTKIAHDESREKTVTCTRDRDSVTCQAIYRGADGQRGGQIRTPWIERMNDQNRQAVRTWPSHVSSCILLPNLTSVLCRRASLSHRKIFIAKSSHLFLLTIHKNGYNWYVSTTVNGTDVE